MMLAIALGIVVAASVAILGPQIVRWWRGEDPFRPLENGRKQR